MPVPQTSSEFRPELADLSTVTEQALFPARPNYPFFFVHHAENWEIGVIDGRAWLLPEMQRQVLEPGVNNIRTLKRGEKQSAAYDTAQLRMTRRGAVIIPHICPVSIVNAKGDPEIIDKYMASLKCKDQKTGQTGIFYMDRWETPRTPRPGKRTKMNRDQDGYNRWRLALVSSGKIKPPHPDIISEKRARADYHAARQSDKVQLPEDVRQRLIDAGEDKADKFDAARVPETNSVPADAKGDTPVKAAPKRKRRAAKKKPVAKKAAKPSEPSE